MDSAMMTVAGVMPIRMNSTPIKTIPGTVFKIDNRGSRYLARVGKRESPIPRERPSTKPMATLMRV